MLVGGTQITIRGAQFLIGGGGAPSKYINPHPWLQLFCRLEASVLHPSAGWPSSGGPSSECCRCQSPERAQLHCAPNKGTRPTTYDL